MNNKKIWNGKIEKNDFIELQESSARVMGMKKEADDKSKLSSLIHNISYKDLEFGMESLDKMFSYWYPDLSKIGVDSLALDTYIATNKKRHLHINIDSSLQGMGLAELMIKAFVYREGYRVVPKGRITSPNFIKVLDKIKKDPKFEVSESDDGEEYIIDEK